MRKYFVFLALLLGIFNTKATNLTFAWDYNSETNLAGYILYYGPYSYTYYNSILLPTNVNTATVSNLVDGSNYFFAVKATNIAGLTSDFSNEIQYTVPPVLNSGLTNNLLILTWSQTNYGLQYTTNLTSGVWNSVTNRGVYVVDTTLYPQMFFKLSVDVPQVITNPPVQNVSILKISPSTSTSSVTKHNITNIPPNSFLVMTSAGESSFYNGSVTSSPVLPWTKNVDVAATNSGDVELWSVVYTNGGNLNITNTWNKANLNCSSVVYVFQNADANKNYAFSSLQSLPNVSLLTTRSNSIILAVSSDWNAKIGIITYLNQPTFKTLEHSISSRYQAAHWYKKVTNINTYVMGESAPTGQKAGTIVYEVRGK